MPVYTDVFQVSVLSVSTLFGENFEGRKKNMTLLHFFYLGRNNRDTCTIHTKMRFAVSEEEELKVYMPSHNEETSLPNQTPAHSHLGVDLIRH